MAQTDRQVSVIIAPFTLLVRLTELPPMSTETASVLIKRHKIENIQAWLEALEQAPSVRSLAPLRTYSEI